MTIYRSLFAIILFGGFGLAFFVGVIYLQIFLSKKENRWLGLILPILSLSLSLMVVIGMTAFTNITTDSSVLTNGTVYEASDQIRSTIVYTPGLAIKMVYIFAICNIPTVICLIIYFSFRKKFSKGREINRMNIQDLE